MTACAPGQGIGVVRRAPGHDKCWALGGEWGGMCGTAAWGNVQWVSSPRSTGTRSRPLPACGSTSRAPARGAALGLPKPPLFGRVMRTLVRAAGLPALLFEESLGIERARRQSRDPEDRRRDLGRDDSSLHGFSPFSTLLKAVQTWVGGGPNAWILGRSRFESPP